MNLRWILFATLLNFTFPAGSALGQRGLQSVPAPDVEAELAQFRIHKGFRIGLFASDPTISKPMQINFDPQGRLWVASSKLYPQIEPERAPSDQILILEDSDGDGRADRRTVFAEGLHIPAGVAPGDGGVYITHGGQLLHLKDSNGDGKADSRRVVLSGFGTEDTHHQLHGLTWGPDGLLYMLQGYYIGSHVETPYGVLRLNGGGTWRFNTASHRLDIYSRGLVNPWGIQFDRWGQTFQTDGAGSGTGIHFSFPGATFVASPGEERILHGLNPGAPKLCGIEIIGGRHLPDEFQNNILSNDYRANRVQRHVIEEDGSGYLARKQPDFIESRHVSFRPVDMAMGPDGAIYIADWYSPIIQHGEVDFRDPRRDRVHGRIWRITHNRRPLVKRPKLIGAKTEELLAAVAAQENYTSRQARRVLIERGAEAVRGPLDSWISGLDRGSEAGQQSLLQGLWLYQALGLFEKNLLTELLTNENHRVRAAAARVTGSWRTAVGDDFLELMAKAIEDQHPRVRLEAVRALSLLPSAHSAELALRTLDQALDPNLDYATWRTIRELKSAWFPALEARHLDLNGDMSRLSYALEAVDSPAAVPHLLRMVDEDRMPQDRLAGALGVLSTHGNPDVLSRVLGAISILRVSEDEIADVLVELIESSRSRGVRPTGDLALVETLIRSQDPEVQVAAVRAAGIWKISSAQDLLTQLARRPGSGQEVRLSAVNSLGLLGDLSTLRELAAVDDPAVRVGACISILPLHPAEAARMAASVLAGIQDVQEASRLFQAFLGQQGGAPLLAEALESHQLSPGVAKTGVYMIRASGRDETVLTRTLMAAGDLSKTALLIAPQEMPNLVQDVISRGDAARGELLYRSEDLVCLKCHAIARSGGRVGPDLSGLGTRAQIDYLVESILEPNEAIKEGFQTINVTTREGQLFSGVKLTESTRELVLQDSEDRVVSIPLSSIETARPGLSLMPSGLADNLSRGEFVDLVKFLYSLGREDAYAHTDRKLVRTWRVLRNTAEVAQKLNIEGADAIAISRLPQRNWLSLYSKVSGSLPMRSLDSFVLGPEEFAFLKFDIQVSSGGRFGLKLPSMDELRLWINGEEFKVQPRVEVALSEGTHTSIVAIKPVRAESLTIELVEGAPTTGHAQFVHGN